MRIIAILFLSIIVLSPAAQPSAGCVVSGADVPAALAEAQAGSRCLEIPAGIYIVQPNTLPGTADNLTIRGAGMGRTILQLPDGLVVNSRSYIVRLTGKDQSISDLSIVGGANASGTQPMLGISLEAGAMRTYIRRIDVSGMYGGNTAGGERDRSCSAVERQRRHAAGDDRGLLHSRRCGNDRDDYQFERQHDPQ